MIISQKIWPEYFEKIKSGDKTFELRLVDWECNIGDTFLLRGWDPKTKEYTGHEVSKEITYVLKTINAKDWGMWTPEEIDKYGFQIIC